MSTAILVSVMSVGALTAGLVAGNGIRDGVRVGRGGRGGNGDRGLAWSQFNTSELVDYPPHYPTWGLSTGDVLTYSRAVGAYPQTAAARRRPTSSYQPTAPQYSDVGQPSDYPHDDDGDYEGGPDFNDDLGPFEWRRNALVDEFKEQGLDVLFPLAGSPLIRIVGKQRTRKSSRGRVLMLIAKVMQPERSLIGITPHVTSQGEADWPECFHMVGRGGDWDNVEAAIDSYFRRISHGNTSPVSMFCDEMGSWSRNLDEALLRDFLVSGVQEAEKHGEQIVLVFHGESNAFVGISGVQNTLRDAYPVFYCYGDTDPRTGNTVATPYFEVKIGGEPFWGEAVYEWPNWLTEAWMFEQFPELLTPATLPPLWQDPKIRRPKAEAPNLRSRVRRETFTQHAAPVATPEAPAIPAHILRAINAQATPEQHRVILGMALDGDILKARKVQARVHPAFQDMTPDDIREVFQVLADLGLGEVVGEGDRLGFQIPLENVAGGKQYSV